MLPQTPHAGTAESPATPSRLERRRKRRKAKTVLTIDPAVRRAVKAAIRRQGFSTLGGIMERLLVLWLRSDWRQRSHMMSFGFYEPDKSHAGNAENMELSIAEFRELQPAKPQQAIRFGDYQIVRTDRDDGGCIIDLGTMQISPAWIAVSGRSGKRWRRQSGNAKPNPAACRTHFNPTDHEERTQ